MIAKLLNPKIIIPLAVVIIVGWFAYTYTTGTGQYGNGQYGPTDRLELDYTAALGALGADKSISFDGSQWTSDRATTGLNPYNIFHSDYYVQVTYTYNGLTRTVKSEVINIYTGLGAEQRTINYRVVTPIWQWHNIVNESAPTNEWEYNGSSIVYKATLFEDNIAVRTITGSV